MPRGTEQLLIAAAVGAGRWLVTAEPSWVAERRGRCNLEQGLGHSAGGRRGRGRRGCPDAGHALRCPVRVLRPPNGHPSTGRAGVRCPSDRCPGDRCDPGVRTDTRPVSASGAAALSARRWILGWVAAAGQPILGRIGWACHGGPRAAWSSLPESSLPESGLAGKRWSFVGRAWLAWVDGTPGRRFACAPAAAPGRPWALAPAPGCRPVGWGAQRRSRCSQSPAAASWADGRRDARRGAIPGRW
jgi:hypothetical protein